MTTLILVRHGRTAWNAVERFRGREDLPLDDTGLAQAERTAGRIVRQWQASALYSSPLLRARQTAEAVARRCGLPVQTDQGLIDIDYGRWQGLTAEEAAERFPRRTRRWYRGTWWSRPAGGEPLRAVRNRCLKAIAAIARRHAGQTVVVVGHTVVNRVILLGALSLGLGHFWQLCQEPCAVNVIETNGRAFVLVSMNDTCHLRESA